MRARRRSPARPSRMSRPCRVSTFNASLAIRRSRRGEEVVERFQDRHLGAEPPPYTAELPWPMNPGPDDAEPLRNLGEREGAFVVDDSVSIHLRDRDTDGNRNPVARTMCRAVRLRRSSEPCRATETRPPPSRGGKARDRLDLVLAQQAGDPAGSGSSPPCPCARASGPDRASRRQPRCRARAAGGAGCGSGARSRAGPSRGCSRRSGRCRPGPGRPSGPSQASTQAVESPSCAAPDRRDVSAGTAPR